jgi:putative glutathione S-transferase
MYLKGLDQIIGLSIVHPVFQKTRPNDPEDTHVGWAFTDPNDTPFLPGPTGLGAYSSAGSIPDTVNNVHFVRDLYDLCSNGTEQKTRYTVPVLWDKKTSTIVSNESSDIVRMFNSAFNSLVPKNHLDLYPEELKEEIDMINEWIYHDISNGVYKCGFASSQEAYNEAVNKLFQALERVEEILSRRRFLCGNTKFTEADIRLFTTLIRFDEVYYVHFKTNHKRIIDFPNLLNYVKDIYQLPCIHKTVNMTHIKDHYYGSHTHLNTYGIVPVGKPVDYRQAHDRETIFGSFQIAM